MSRPSAAPRKFRAPPARRCTGLLCLLLLAAGVAAAPEDGGRERHLAFLSSPEVSALPRAEREAVVSRYVQLELARLGFEGAGAGGSFFISRTSGESGPGPHTSLSLDGEGLSRSEGDFSAEPVSPAGKAAGPVVAEGDLAGAVALITVDDFTPEEVENRAAVAAGAGAVAALLVRRRWDRIRFADGREAWGRAEDLGDRFRFTPAGEDHPREYGLREVRSIRFGPSLSAPAAKSWRGPVGTASIPLLRVSHAVAERLVGGGGRAALGVEIRRRQVERRHVAAVLRGRSSPLGASVWGFYGEPESAACALSLAAALAARPRERDVQLALSPGGAPPPVKGGGRTVHQLLPGREADVLASVLERIDRPPPSAGESPPGEAFRGTYEAAVAARVAGDADRALREIEAALAGAPDDVRLLLFRGRLLLAAGRKDGARADAALLRKTAPDSGLGELLAFDVDGRPEDLEKALGKNCGAALLRRARERLGDGDLPGYQADLRQVVAAGGESAAAWCARANLLLGEGRRDEAKALFDRAVAADPGDPEAAYGLGSFHALEGEDHEEALRLLFRAEALGFADPALLFDRGLTLLRVRRFPAAVADFEEYLSRRPGHAAATYNIACAHALRGDTKAAFQWLGEALEAGFGDLDHARRDPDLESLRGDPRFERLLRSADAE